MENLLFSICRFRQFTGVYPQNITIVSYSFKEERFVHQHAPALQIPHEMIMFIGTPALDREGAEKVLLNTTPTEWNIPCISARPPCALLLA